MELELGRHDWASLDTPVGGDAPIRHALDRLVGAGDPDTAEDAADLLHRLALDHKLLAASAPAIASVLVHFLWARRPGAGPDPIRALILDLLFEIATGQVYEPDPEVYGPVTVEACLAEIRSGFPAYVEILDSDAGLEEKVSCVDLIARCGETDPWLRDRALYFLRAALAMPDLVDERGQILMSIKALGA